MEFCWGRRRRSTSSCISLTCISRRLFSRIYKRQTSRKDCDFEFETTRQTVMASCLACSCFSRSSSSRASMFSRRRSSKMVSCSGASASTRWISTKRRDLVRYHLERTLRSREGDCESLVRRLKLGLEARFLLLARLERLAEHKELIRHGLGHLLSLHTEACLILRKNDEKNLKRGHLALEKAP